jgi:hypothetical protein
LGCKLAINISTMNEKTVRQKYGIPSKFKDTTMEKIKELVAEETSKLSSVQSI